MKRSKGTRASANERVLCGWCGRRARALEAHECDHGVPCGTPCQRCVEVELFAVEGDERVSVRPHGMFEVELEIRGTFSVEAFRRIATAIRADWDHGAEEARTA